MDSPPGLPTVGGDVLWHWGRGPGQGQEELCWQPLKTFELGSCRKVTPDGGQSEAGTGQESGLWVQPAQTQTTILETAVLLCPGHRGGGRGSPERGPGWGKERR